jgi:hypothetical protein
MPAPGSKLAPRARQVSIQRREVRLTRTKTSNPGHNTITMTLRCSSPMTEHLHRAMNSNGAFFGTYLGAGAADMKG